MRWISVNILDHDRVEIFEGHLSISIAVGLLHHQSQGLLVQVFLDMVVHLLEVVNGEVVLVVSVVFLEDGGDFFLCLASEGLRIHRFHELYEADASGFLGVELCHDLVGGLSIGCEAVLGKE